VIVRAILSSAFDQFNQQLRFVIIDCIWRFIWAVFSLMAVFVLGTGVLAQMGALEWEGPDLGSSSPIIVLAAFRQFWNSYGVVVVTALGLLLLALLVLWIVLESLFRGGWKNLWIYFGTGMARTTLLLGTTVIFLMLSARDASGGTLAIGIVVVLGLWFIVGVLETLVRRDATDLLATDLLPLAAVLGCLRFAEGLLAFLLFGCSVTVLLKSTEIALAGLFAGFVVLFWMLIHSYLVALQYSAIDIMRRNVVGS
jgi:hypothetical protein